MHLPEIKRNIGFSYVDLSQEKEDHSLDGFVIPLSGHFEVV